MARNYVKKKPPKQYSLDDINAAVGEIKKHTLTFRQAALKYKVPSTVLHRRIKHCRVLPEEKLSGGTKCQLSREVEDTLEACIIARSEWGFPVDKAELFDLVEHYVVKQRLKTKFKNSRPGEDWYRRFMRDHPRVSLRKPEQLQKTRVDAADPFVVNDFYDKMEKTINKYKLQNSPELVFNCDESGYPTDPSKVKALGPKGKKAFYRNIGGTGRENITVNSCVSASGDKLPPHIIFKGQAVQPRWLGTDEYPGTFYTASKKGYMEECIFFMWLKESFVPFVNNVRSEQNKQSMYAVLIYDGHASHVSVRVIALAIDNNIVLVRLPSHLTHRLQPLDVAVFAPVKLAWERKLVEYGKSNMGSSSFRLSRSQFSSFVGEVWRDSANKRNIIAGFKETGCFPVDRHKFPASDYRPESLARYNASLMPMQSEKLDPRAPGLPESVVGDRPICQDSLDKEVVSTRNQAPPAVDLEPAGPSSEGNASTSLADIGSRRPASSMFSVDQSPSTSRHMPESSSGSVGSVNSRITKISPNVREVADILLGKMKSLQPSKSTSAPIPPERQIRLKHLKYGEVLTSKSVHRRILEEEQKRSRKKGNKDKPKLKTTTNTKLASKPKPKKRRRPSTSDESVASSDEDLLTDLMVESDQEEEADAVSSEEIENPPKKPPPSYEVGQYYAASYDSKWYVGRILRSIDLTYELKFLERIGDTYRWPTRDDFDQVHKNRLFCGPITLSGVTSFKVNPNCKAIEAEWAKHKKMD